MAGEYIEFNNASQPAINDTNLNRLQQLIKQDIQGAVSGDTLPIGAIIPFGSDTIPENWLLCDGSAVSRTTYQDLFNTIGTSYGQGDGFTTFNLPDLRGRVGVGKSSDTEFDTLGETGGEKTHTLIVNEMPDHGHYISSGATGSTTFPAYSGVAANYTGSTSMQQNPLNLTHTGGGQAHNNLQPYIVTNYIIKASQTSGVVATVVDNLNSDSSTSALSARQGKVLNDRSTYSTTETIVGTWIDGKPLYRKTIPFNVTSYIGGIFTFAHGLSNFSLKKIEGILYDGSTYYYNLSHSTGGPDAFGASDASSKGVVITNSAVMLGFATDSSGMSGHVTLYYTKTTD